ncbi:MAG: GNAT family N-acetyltransferase [Arenimonas sp.]
MQVLQTQRLNLRWLNDDDAEFILDLLNQASWLEFIGDRGVRNLDDALAYIHNGPLAMIQQHGFGLYLVETKSNQLRIGLCGLLKRDTLEDVDIGFALHPDSWGKGYAKEAAQACLNFAGDTLVLQRVVAITLPSNTACITLLNAIGMHYEKNICLGESEEILQLFSNSPSS